MKRNYTRFILLGLFMSIFFIVMQASQTMAVQKSKTLILGHLSAFSGGAAFYGEDGKRSAILAMEEINARGGITVAGERYLIDIIHLDTKYQASGAVAGFQRLVELHNVHFIHNMGTSTTLALLPLNEKAKVLLDATATSGAATGSGNDLVIVSVSLVNAYDPALAKEAIKRGLKTMAIIADKTDFGKVHVEGMRKYYEKLGGKILGVEAVETIKASDFYPQATKLKGLKPDCIFVVAQGEPGGRIAKQIREIGYKGILVFTEAFKKSAMEIAGMRNIEGSFFAGTSISLISSLPKGTPDKYIRYRESYLKRWPGKNISGEGPFAYYWLYYLTKAMEIAGTTTDAYAVKKACNEAVLESDFLLDIKGFTSGGRAYGQKVYLLEVKNGKVAICPESTFIYTKELAQEPEK